MTAAARGMEQHVKPMIVVVIVDDNGKLNLDALPTPDSEESPTAGFVEPCGQVELVLAGLWREVLELSYVGAHGDFFELGGDSLKAVQLLVRGSERFGLVVPVVVIFENPTITGLADC